MGSFRYQAGMWLSSLAGMIAIAAAPMGCNLITTADSLYIGDGEADGQGSVNPGQGGNGASGASGPGLGGSGATGGGDGASGAGGPVDDLVATDGVTVTDIVMYQSVARPLLLDGVVATSSTPVVANRDALVRVFYDIDGYNGQPVTARLTIGDEVVQMQTSLGNGSSENNLQSTVNFDVSAEMIQPGAGYRVDLLQAPEQASGTNAAATFPQGDGLQSLGATSGGALRITLVPVQYNGDGSGRMPDTSAAQLQRYADMFYAMYPITEVDISVRNPYPWNSTLSSNGGGWETLLNAIADLRNSDGAGFQQYYYGIFEPANSFNQYCNGGCVLGLGFLGGPSDAWAHAAIGIGFTGDRSVETAVHELGHNHGRQHAPCGGASGVDGNYPYGGAVIGTQGYNLLSGTLYPSTHFDMMSYCGPAWISDYTYTELFKRTQFNNSSNQLYVPPQLLNQTWERALVHGDGSMSWMAPIELERPVFGETVSVTSQTTQGPEHLDGRLVRYDHIDGGVLFIPPTAAPRIPGALMKAYVDGQLNSVVQ